MAIHIHISTDGHAAAAASLAGSMLRPVEVLLDLTDDSLLTLAFVIGENRVPSVRRQRALMWDSPITSAAIELKALSCTCHALHTLLASHLTTLREHLLEKLRCSQGSTDVTRRRLADQTLLLWRSALLKPQHRCAALAEDRVAVNPAQLAATEREIAALTLPADGGARPRSRTTRSRLKLAPAQS